jgi:hypothetical protein
MTMAIMSRDNMRSYERTRASNIVLAYETELREKLTQYPSAKNAGQVEALISHLADIRKQIMGSMREYCPPIKRDPDGDFSLEEIEAAMEFVQGEANPFEGN